MAFLDNSGDIILDAVLTDAGRKRMAEGDFKITKFALGDDEIDYSLYDPQHPNGSSYFDLDIFNTPILEAFTDNMSGLKSKLVTYDSPNLLYLPVIKIETGAAAAYTNDSGSFYVAVDRNTYNSIGSTNGVLDGFDIDATQAPRKENYILLNQGIDNEGKESLDEELQENQYIIEIDNRLGVVAQSPVTTNAERYQDSYVDDDDKASYILTDTNTEAVFTGNQQNTVIAGPLGFSLRFTIWAKAELRQRNFLWQKLGGQITLNSNDFYYIDTNVRVVGVNTGYRLDIPVRFLKKI